MWGRLGVPVVVAVAVSAGLAFGQGRPPRPAKPAQAKALRLPAIDHCVRRSVRVTLVPPEGDSFASLSVLAGADEVLQLANLSGPGSFKVTLPYGRTRVRVAATLVSGRFVRAGRTYRRCTPHPQRPKPGATATPTPTPITGGGET